MSSVVLAFLIMLLIAGAWMGWRYWRLRMGIQALVAGLRRAPDGEPSSSVGELAPLAWELGAWLSGYRTQASRLGVERDRLAAVLNQMTDGVLIADSEGRIALCNPAASRLFDMEQPVGRTVAEVLRNHQLIAVWRRCQEADEFQSETVEIPARHQFLQFIAMPDLHGSGSLLLVQDLTRMRRLETVRRDFVSNISHELRTPLASLRALTETLQDGALADRQAAPQFLDQMVKEVDALSQMTQELLDLSRIESGQIELTLSRTAVRELLDSAAARMQAQAERAGVALRVDCPDDLPELWADPGRLEQVLVSLIHNGVKFTRPGGEVVLSASTEAPDPLPSSATPLIPSVTVAVRDTGVGIPADDVPRIFERFYQVDKARAGHGTGLGLSIARHIVEAHDGRIWVESLEGRGSTFFFTIPRAPQS
jgi:two-component system, OmpR family, phosphate regulon sensor histidine kinase PhoR